MCAVFSIKTREKGLCLFIDIAHVAGNGRGVGTAVAEGGKQHDEGAEQSGGGESEIVNGETTGLHLRPHCQADGAPSVVMAEGSGVIGSGGTAFEMLARVAREQRKGSDGEDDCDDVGNEGDIAVAVVCPDAVGQEVGLSQDDNEEGFGKADEEEGTESGVEATAGHRG